MLKVMTVVGTRPEIIKLSRVISELDKSFEHILVHTGQNYDYELNEIFFNDMNIRKPDVFLNCAAQSPAQAIANIISSVDTILEKEEPDAFLIYGDTNSCLSSISAKRRKVPIFHMEAGNRSFDERVPEEINRRIVDHTSDINMTITDHARKYLIQEGIKAQTIFKIGSSMQEVLSFYNEKIKSSPILGNLDLQSRKYIVFSTHREENLDSNWSFTALVKSINDTAASFGLPIIYSAHPRFIKTLDMSELKLHGNVRILKPLGFLDYMHLQLNAFCVISDSGTIFEESSLCSFPAVTIRFAHERPEGFDEGTVVLSNPLDDSLIESIRLVTEQHARGFRSTLVGDYAGSKVSVKVARIISSYVTYVNQTVWRK